MKTIIGFLLLSAAVALAREELLWVGPLPKKDRAPLQSLDRERFLSATNVERVIWIPDVRWKPASAGLRPLLEAFKKAFVSSGVLVVPPKKWEEELQLFEWRERRHMPEKGTVFGLGPGHEQVASGRILWSDVYFLTKEGGFLTFGETVDGFIFFTDKTAGFLPTTAAEPDGPASRSQPVRSATNSTPAAAGSRR